MTFFLHMTGWFVLRKGGLLFEANKWLLESCLAKIITLKRRQIEPCFGERNARGWLEQWSKISRAPDTAAASVRNGAGRGTAAVSIAKLFGETLL